MAKHSKSLVPLQAQPGQVIDVPWRELKDKEITLRLIELLRDQPLLAVVFGVIVAELAEKSGLLTDNWASVIQGTIATMGVASAFKQGGLVGGTLAGGAGALTGTLLNTEGLGILDKALESLPGGYGLAYKLLTG